VLPYTSADKNWYLLTLLVWTYYAKIGFSSTDDVMWVEWIHVAFSRVHCSETVNVVISVGVP